jgi:hypothetical protein
MHMLLYLHLILQVIINSNYNLDKTSFLSLPKWLKDVSNNIPENAYKIACGNKLDMEKKRYIAYYIIDKLVMMMLRSFRMRIICLM